MQYDVGARQGKVSGISCSAAVPYGNIKSNFLHCRLSKFIGSCTSLNPYFHLSPYFSRVHFVFRAPKRKAEISLHFLIRES